MDIKAEITETGYRARKAAGLLANISTAVKNKDSPEDGGSTGKRVQSHHQGKRTGS